MAKTKKLYIAYPRNPDWDSQVFETKSAFENWINEILVDCGPANFQDQIDNYVIRTAEIIEEIDVYLPNIPTITYNSPLPAEQPKPKVKKVTANVKKKITRKTRH